MVADWGCIVRKLVRVADGRVKPYQIHTSKNRTSFQLVAGICFRSGIVQASPPNTSNGSKFDSNTTLWAARSDLRIRLRNKMCASGRVKMLWGWTVAAACILAVVQNA